MSDDLIYRSALKEHIGSYAGMFTDELGFVVSLEAVLRGIDFAESADAVEVVHGEWIEVPNSGIGNTAKCSRCGKCIYGYVAMNYCPDCGADMRERKNDE